MAEGDDGDVAWSVTIWPISDDVDDAELAPSSKASPSFDTYN